jgi:hypothetical protein
MKDNFNKYELMRDAGALPHQVYQQAVSDGIDAITRIRLIRAVFSLSPGQAKDVIVRAEGESRTSDEHQGKLVDAVAAQLSRSLPVGPENALR